MRTLIITFSLCFLSTLSFGQSHENKAENLGLISELVYIKLTSEYVAIQLLNDTLIKPDEKNKYVNLYNETKIITDQVIIQLIADSRINNSLRFFKKIDKLLVRKTIIQIEETDFKSLKLEGYLKNLKKVNLINSQLIAFNPGKKPELKSILPSTASVGELTGVLNFIMGTIKDIRANKEKKVEKLSGILNDLRLKSLQELSKDKTTKT